jgi:hypothetical protein
LRVDGKRYVTCRRYDRENDVFVDVDPPQSLGSLETAYKQFRKDIQAAQNRISGLDDRIQPAIVERVSGVCDTSWRGIWQRGERSESNIQDGWRTAQELNLSGKDYNV